MRITDVTTVPLTVPLTADPYILPFKRQRSAAFIEVHDASGQVGIGETYAGYFIPEVAPAIVDFFAPILSAADTDDIYTLHRRMLDCGSYWCRTGLGPAVVSGIEAALWDLKGKLLGLPVYELLGGKCHDRLPAYATGGPANWPLDRLRAKLDFYLGLGFRGVKVATGYFDDDTRAWITPTTTAAHVEMEATKAAAMRAHVGPDVRLLMDGYMGFKQGVEQWDRATALAVLKALAPYDIFFFEEPLPYTDAEGYGLLSQATSIRVAGGESLTSVEEFRPFAQHGAATWAAHHSQKCPDPPCASRAPLHFAFGPGED